MLGMTWARTLDGALDEISRLQAERDNARDAIDEFLEQHPHHEADAHLTLARVALT